MNLLLIIMNSYVNVWSYMNKYDFMYKRISDLEHLLTFFINIFSPGLTFTKHIKSAAKLRT